MNLLTSFLTNAASAHLKQVAIKTASGLDLPSTIAIALAIINFKLELWAENPNFS